MSDTTAPVSEPVAELDNLAQQALRFTEHIDRITPDQVTGHRLMKARLEGLQCAIDHLLWALNGGQDPFRT